MSIRVIKGTLNWEMQASALLPHVDNTITCPGCGFIGISPNYDGDQHDLWSNQVCITCENEFCGECVPLESTVDLICYKCNNQ